jgi:hypothetical protein
VAWQIPLLTLPRARFLLMSATLGETAFFEESLTRITGLPAVTVRSETRPVPLEFTYAETPLAQTLEALVTTGKSPVYVVHFTQADAAENAQAFTSIPVATRDERAAIATALEGFSFNSPHGPDIRKWLRQGIGIHHAGLLPKYRILVEQLAQKGLLKVICGTDTLGVGINVPIRTVLFTRLFKYGGEKVAILNSRDFHQISGRAGRKGFDSVGYVVVQAPEHVIDNLKLEEKAKRDGKKIVKRQAPDRNFVNWDRNTFIRLQSAPPERLVSRFQVTHAMLLNVLGRPTDGCTALQQLIRNSHESDRQKKAHRTRAWQLFRSLVDRGIIEFIPQTAEGAKLRVNVALPEDFSLNQVLSLYLLDTIPLLDPAAPDYPLDLLTLVESILEEPEAILRAQLNRLKGEKVAELKAQGMEYDDRMAELEKLEHPKPRREFIYETFNAWSEKHPWVGTENIRPKSIAREMFEQFRSFGDYIKIYELFRTEGLLLRHLNSVYKVLSQTVPASAKTEAVRDMEAYLVLMLRQVDSSLLDEWERMRNPEFQAPVATPEVRPPGAEAAAADITRDIPAFTAAIRVRIFGILRSIANGDFEEVLTQLAAPNDVEGNPWTVLRLRAATEHYRDIRKCFLLDPGARNLRNTLVTRSGPEAERKTWIVRQILIDPEEHNDWMMEFEVDLEAARAAKTPGLQLLRWCSIV